jgi:hypothetical protein
MFWLDRHYSGGFTAKGEKDCPIIEELDAISNGSHLKHSILIDDAGDLYENQALTPQNIQANFNCHYGCGIFELRKK